MSKKNVNKTILVFSTYYIYPNKIDCLFNENNFEKGLFCNKTICDFFLEKLGENKNEVKKFLTDSAKQELSPGLVNVLAENKDSIKTIIETINEGNQNKIDYSIDKLDWVGDFLDLILKREDIEDIFGDKEIKIILDISEKYTDYCNASLDGKDSTWIVANLLSEGSQNIDGLDLSEEINRDNPDNEPWLYNRFSYYKLKNLSDNDNYAIYAVWPLHKTSDDKTDNLSENLWIKGLTEQFCTIEPEAERIIMMLHDKDIYKGATYTICSREDVEYENDSGKAKVERIIGVFQHVDEIGIRLKDKSTNPNDLLEYIYKGNDIRQINQIVKYLTGEDDFQVSESETVDTSVANKMNTKLDMYNWLKPQVEKLITEKGKTCFADYLEKKLKINDPVTPEDIYDLLLQINNCIYELS